MSLFGAMISGVSGLNAQSQIRTKQPEGFLPILINTL